MHEFARVAYMISAADLVNYQTTKGIIERKKQLNAIIQYYVMMALCKTEYDDNISLEDLACAIDCWMDLPQDADFETIKAAISSHAVLDRDRLLSSDGVVDRLSALSKETQRQTRMLSAANLAAYQTQAGMIDEENRLSRTIEIYVWMTWGSKIKNYEKDQRELIKHLAPFIDRWMETYPADDPETIARDISRLLTAIDVTDLTDDLLEEIDHLMGLRPEVDLKTIVGIINSFCSGVITNARRFLVLINDKIIDQDWNLNLEDTNDEVIDNRDLSLEDIAAYAAFLCITANIIKRLEPQEKNER